MAAPGRPAKPIHVGSSVRIVGRPVLDAALRRATGRRPEPAQMRWAGRAATVAGVRLGNGSVALYVLREAPGLWPEAWIDPA